MANRNDPFFNRLTQLFRSGPAIQRKVKGYDYKNYYDNQLARGNSGHRGPFPFGRESSPFSVLGSYGILDRMSRYCFSGDTLIATNTKDGSIRIDELASAFINGPSQEKYHTFAYDHETNSVVLAEITNAFKTKTDNVIEVHLDNGAVFKCTKDHRFMLRDGSYKEAQLLQENDTLMPFNGKELIPYKNHKVVKIVDNGEITEVYDITVANYHNFAILGAGNINACFVHNSDFASMEYTPEIAAALNIIADECSAGDERGKAFHLYSKNPEVKKALEELFYDILNIDFNIRPWVRNLVKYGDFFMYLEVVPDIGIINVQPIPVNELEREDGFDQNDPYAVRYKWLTRGNRYLENWQVAHMRILGNDLFLPYGTCHEKTTKILTSNGIKEIQDIVIGDEVVSWDIDSRKKIISSVLGTKNSGTKECFEIRTRHNELRTSKEHQILIFSRLNNAFLYKSTLELEIGDLLAVSPNHKQCQSAVIDKTKPTNAKNGYWKNIDNIPETVTAEFARLFGFLLGDGWISGNQVCFACGVESPLNDYYSKLLEKFAGGHIDNRTDRSSIVCSSKTLSTVLKRMGFHGKASTKRIPPWVFSVSPEIQASFVEGLFDADGSLYTDKWNCERRCFELSNLELIKDIKAVCQSLGYKTGKISARKLRKEQAVIEGRVVKNTLPSYMFYWFKSQLTQIKKWRPTVVDVACDVIFEPIISIKTIGERETYDIYVENNNHNFFANGIVTHNSILEPARRVWNQLTLMEDSMLTYRVVRSPERRVFYIDVGNIAPNDVPSYMEAAKETLKSRSQIDKSTGQMDSRYNPLDIEADYFIPVRGGQTGTKIETLPGGTNATAVDDVKYLQSKLFAALQVPKAFLNFNENLGAKASLAQQDVRFSRTISVLQRVILSELNKMAMIHLYSKGFDGEDLIAYELRLSNPSTVAMQQKLEAMSTKFDIAGKAKETKLVDEDWIQRTILELTEDDIIKIETGRRRDKVREVEIEAVAIAENLPQKNTVTDPFDPSGYTMPGEDVKKNPPLGGSTIVTDIPTNQTTNIQNAAAAGAAIAGNPGAKAKSPTSGVPIKANPFLARAKHNNRRLVGMAGRDNLQNPNFADMLSATNKHMADITDKHSLTNLSEKTLGPIETTDINLDEYRPPPVMTSEVIQLKRNLDKHFAKIGGRKKKILITESDVNLSKLDNEDENNLFELTISGDDVVVEAIEKVSLDDLEEDLKNL